ncbi:MAG: acetate--CoA ligase family protein [Chloroflexi bacterium]|nr:acetate--CoA ligase family protein [Chloroflexota bacterium]
MRIEPRTHHSSLITHHLLAPRSVAVVGASPSGGRGATMIRNLQSLGFEGSIYAINPKYSEVLGVPCFPSLSETPALVDCVAIALGSRGAVSALQSAAAVGIPAAVVVAAGFAETGVEGRALQAELTNVARSAQMQVVGPNCYGVLNPVARSAVFGANIPNPSLPGTVGFVLQSGALSHGITDVAAQRGLGFSLLVTTGNEAVLEAADFLLYLATDPNTKVLAAFIEGFRTPERFVQAAAAARAAGKPLVILKVGRSAQAQRATLAHTGALAGADRVTDALFRQYGVIRVRDLNELIETTTLLSGGRLPVASGVAIAGISGGACGLLSDLADDLGLPLPALTADTHARLVAALPDFATPNNPLDATGAVGEDRSIFATCLDVLASDPGIGALAVGLNSPMSSNSSTIYRDMASMAIAAAQEHEKPFLALTFSSGGLDPELVAVCRRGALPLLQGAETSVRALAHWVRFAGFRRRWTEWSSVGAAGDSPVTVYRRELPRDLEQALAVDRAAASSGPSTLNEIEARALLSAYGIRGPRERVVTSAEAAVAAASELGFPVVLKIVSPDIAHKTDAGGVVVGVTDAAGLMGAYNQIMSNVKAGVPGARVEGVLVQEQIVDGVEALLGVSRDPQFGPVIAFGLGGIFTEVLDDVALRLPPVTRADAEDMIGELRGAAIMGGPRGRPPADVDAVAQAIVALSELVSDWGDRLQGVDVNPLLVRPAGKGVVAVDALIELCPPR